MPDFLSSPYFLCAAGAVVGAGILAIGLIRWWKALTSGNPGPLPNPACPWTGDHPKIRQFMGESTEDRKHLREFVEEVNTKVDDIKTTVDRSDAKLELILKNAKVIWNG